MSKLKHKQFKLGEEEKIFNFKKPFFSISSPGVKRCPHFQGYLIQSVPTDCMNKTKQKQFNLGVQR